MATSTLYEQYLSRMSGERDPARQTAVPRGARLLRRPGTLLKRTLATRPRRRSARRTPRTLIRLLMQRPSASAATWEHLKTNWETVEQIVRHLSGHSHRGRVGSAPLRRSVEKRRRAGSSSMHPVAGTDRTLQQSLERHRSAARRTKSAQADDLAAFLSSAGP